MHFTALDYAFAAAGFIGHSTLLYVLLVRRIARQFPLFTVFVIFQLVRTAIFLPIQLSGSKMAYYYAYYALDVFDALFTAGVVYGIVASVFRPLGYWAPDVRVRGIALLLVAGMVAIGVTAQIHPPVDLLIQKIVFRANFFVALLMVEVFAIIMAESSRAGLAWRHHIRCVADAFAIYFIMFLVAEWGHSHYGANSVFYQRFAHVRIAAYWLALVYLIVVLSLPEPALKIASPATIRAIFGRPEPIDDQPSRTRRS